MTTHIHRLPVELLIVILKLVIEGSGHAYARQRTTLTLVSRTLRDVIAHTPSFWTKISGNNSLPLNRLALLHSRDLPLDVDFFLEYRRPSEDKLDSYREACHALPRWRTAVVGFRARDTIVQLLTKPAPSLERINIEIYPAHESDLHVDLFGGHAPLLQSVLLCGMSIPWGSGMLSGLKVLSLSDIIHSPPTVNDILFILASSPQLRVLKLCYIDFKAGASQTSQWQVNLQDLQLLNLSDMESSSATAILQHIKPVPCLHVTLVCILENDPNPASCINLLRPFLPAVVSGESHTDLRLGANHLDYALGGSSEARISLEGVSSATLLPILLSALPPQHLALDMIIKTNEDEQPELHTLLMAANAAHVTSLTMDAPPPADRITLDLLAEPRGDPPRWLFPSMQQLSIGIHDSTACRLTRMVRMRYGIERTSELGDGSQRDPDLPLPFTSLHVYGLSSKHSEGYDTLQETVGPSVLSWKWREY